MESFPNSGRLHVHTIHQHAGAPCVCATRLGKKAPYQYFSMKLLWRLSLKGGLLLVVKSIGLLHCLPSVKILLRTSKDAGAEGRN